MSSVAQAEKRNDINVVPRAPDGKVLPGHSLNPGGKAKGTRAALSTTFLKDAHRAWEKHGPKALDRMAHDDPGAFVKVMAGLMPKNINLNMGVQDQLAELLERMNAQPGDKATVVEASDISDLADTDSSD